MLNPVLFSPHGSTSNKNLFFITSYYKQSVLIENILSTVKNTVVNKITPITFRKTQRDQRPCMTFLHLG